MAWGDINKLKTARKLIPMTKDTDYTAEEIRAIYIGVGGELVIFTPGNSTAVTLKNTVAGTTLDIQVTKVDGSSAATDNDIVGLQ